MSASPSTDTNGATSPSFADAHELSELAGVVYAIDSAVREHGKIQGEHGSLLRVLLAKRNRSAEFAAFATAALALDRAVEAAKHIDESPASLITVGLLLVGFLFVFRRQAAATQPAPASSPRAASVPPPSLPSA